MQVIPLDNGRVVFQAKFEIMLTEYDLTAAVMWSIKHMRQAETREQVEELTKKVIEAHGVQGLVRAMNRYKPHQKEARALIQRLFPEVKRRKHSTDISCCLLVRSNN